MTEEKKSESLTAHDSTIREPLFEFLELQMQTYLVVVDFRRRRNKQGEEYGMPVCYYEWPEDKWGYDLVTGAYAEVLKFLLTSRRKM